jgi:hypothetical protein
MACEKALALGTHAPRAVMIEHLYLEIASRCLGACKNAKK